MELSLTESLLVAILMALVGIFFVLLSIAGFGGWLRKIIFPPMTDLDDRGLGECVADWFREVVSGALTLAFGVIGLVTGAGFGWMLVGMIFDYDLIFSSRLYAVPAILFGFLSSFAGILLAIDLRERILPPR